MSKEDKEDKKDKPLNKKSKCPKISCFPALIADLPPGKKIVQWDSVSGSWIPQDGDTPKIEEPVNNQCFVVGGVYTGILKGTHLCAFSLEIPGKSYSKVEIQSIISVLRRACANQESFVTPETVGDQEGAENVWHRLENPILLT